jgi:hypothetical protein
MKKKFYTGDHVTIKSNGVYQETQESLNGHKGTIVNTIYYPDNIHVRVETIKGKPVMEFSVTELIKEN